ncbi:MAG: patatin-like phospholipase family protein [Pseudohongiella sp.]|nr:patatin-like phospholipase family protein [Pseudohongiella sp.]MDO9519637.1 patatin-like phospholipase family protein [Pseudohongiella sp.]MDP2127668.1 patatin-like phospholipase family protein [Pseudohongiella sp.]
MNIQHVSGTQQETALVLSGGGARAAYQVGALRGIASVLDKDVPNPFGIISGTSAGAMNAVGLATHAHKFRTGVKMLEYVWSNISSSQIYRLDSTGLVSSASNWVFSFLANRKGRSSTSLLDNSPLDSLLHEILRLERINENMNAGYLNSLVVTASGYTSGESVSFFQSSKPIENWQRPHRLGIRTEIRHKHLLASSAIPTLFPAVKINREYYGDGAIRQLAPLSPAIHMGADRILAIGVSGSRTRRPKKGDQIAQPSLSQIVGHVLNSAFVDTLESDMAVLRRYNNLIPLCADGAALDVKPVHLLEITPSLDLNRIAEDFYQTLPRSIRLFIRDTNSSTIASLLMFEKDYCQALMDLGIADALAKREQIHEFFRVRSVHQKE